MTSVVHSRGRRQTSCTNGHRISSSQSDARSEVNGGNQADIPRASDGPLCSVAPRSESKANNAVQKDWNTDAEKVFKVLLDLRPNKARVEGSVYPCMAVSTDPARTECPDLLALKGRMIPLCCHSGFCLTFNAHPLSSTLHPPVSNSLSIKATSAVKEESKKLDPLYTVTGASDGIASEAKRVYIMNKQSEERLWRVWLFENSDDVQVSLISFYICEILNRACRVSQQT